jgi:hypothetical protein
MSIENLINLEISISTNKIYLKIQYFSFTKFCYLKKKVKKKFNISENNIIGVKATKGRVGYNNAPAKRERIQRFCSIYFGSILGMLQPVYTWHPRWE